MMFMHNLLPHPARGNWQAEEKGSFSGFISSAGGKLLRSWPYLRQKREALCTSAREVIFWICVVVWLMNYRHFTDPVTLRGELRSSKL